LRLGKSLWEVRGVGNKVAAIFVETLAICDSQIVRRSTIFYALENIFWVYCNFLAILTTLIALFGYVGETFIPSLYALNFCWTIEDNRTLSYREGYKFYFRFHDIP